MTVEFELSSRRCYGVLIAIAMLCLAMVLALNFAAEEADAWEDVSTQPRSSSGGHAYKYVYQSTSTSTSYSKYSTSSPYLGYYGYISSTYVYTYYYEPYYQIPLNLVDKQACIDSATLQIQTSGYSINQDVQAKFLSVDPEQTSPYVSPQTVYDDIRSTSGAVIGTLRIASYGTYTYTFSSTALTYLRNSIQSGTANAWIGFAMTTEPAPPSSSGSFYYRQYLYPYRITMTYKVDRSAPNVPTLSGLPTWTLGSSVTAQWPAVSDLPTGGSRGGVEYSARMQLWDGGTWVTHRLPPWSSATSATFNNLIDGGYYRVQVQARDASDYRSAWSTANYTSIDSSPPTVPILASLPEYTSGTALALEWSASTDAGIGLTTGPPYELQWSKSFTFATYSSMSVWGTSTSVSGLESNAQYFYRVRAEDMFGQFSAWSPIESTILDDDPPSIPSLWEEEKYTSGTTNMLTWHASTDVGIGLKDYYVQVATDDRFISSDRVLDAFVQTTFVEVTGLADGTTYYCRVASRDQFDHTSAWSQVASSTQDDSGPSAPVVQALPPYSPAGAVTLKWEVSSDDGVGLGWYKVMVSKDVTFHQVDRVYDRVTGNVWDHVEIGSHCETIYLRVVPVDLLGNEGGPGDANTAMDIVAPEAPAIGPLPKFTPDGELTLSWSASMDNGSGVDHYIVRVLMRPGSGPILTVMTNMTSTKISGLADGVTYWYQVTAVDMAGNANTSELASSTQDGSPPTRPFLEALPDLTPDDTVTLLWEPAIDAGVGGVEYEVAWSTGASPDSTMGGITVTSVEVTDLADGTAYYFWVRSRDGFGHVGLWSPRVSTTMDASPPGVPSMDTLPGFLQGPSIAASWGPVTDASGLQVLYRVSVYDDPGAMSDPVAQSPWLPETRYEFWGLDEDITLYFRAESHDPFGWTSQPSEPSSTTIDGTGPSGVVIDGLPEFSRGSGLLVTWSTAIDGGIGGVEHRLVVYADVELKVPIQIGQWTEALGAKIVGLSDGEALWFVVECRDGLGNVGLDSDPVSTTMDAIPPSLWVDAPGLFGPEDGAVTGTFSDAGSGVAIVEGSSDGGVTWEDAEMEDGGWSMAFPSSSWSGMLMVRATDGVGNVVTTPVTAVVDQTRPTVNIASPVDGTDIHGSIPILGTIADDHLESYQVDYMGGSSGDWRSVQPPQSTSGMSGTLATWTTSGLSDGAYTLRVTAQDALGNSEEVTLTVTLMGAHLTVSPSDITFSDSHPLPGDKVTVMVTVRNSGDSPAEDVAVILSSGAKVVDVQTGIIVPAHGTYITIFSVRAEEGSTEFFARATSPFYDTGEMTSGKPLTTIEEEGVLENAAGVLGLVALILAVMVLAILLVSRMGRGKKEEIVEPEPDEILIDPLEDLENGP